MRAIVLAAGYATRLHPFTERFPKALLEVQGGPLLEPTMERLLRVSDISSIVVVSNARFAPLFARWLDGFLARHNPPIPVEILNDGTWSNDERLGSIGDLAYALRERASDEDVLLLPSDRLFSFELGELVEHARAKGAPVVACHDVGSVERIRRRHGCVLLDTDGRVVRFEEKPAEPFSTIAAVALYVFPARTLEAVERYLCSGANPDAPGHYLQWLAASTAVYGWLMSGECRDVGDMRAYLELACPKAAACRGAVIAECREDRGQSPPEPAWSRDLGQALDQAHRDGALLASVRLRSARPLEGLQPPIPMTVTIGPAVAEGHRTAHGCFRVRTVPLRELLPPGDAT